MGSNCKIFVIGFNKTGTCSFNKLFKTVGINSIHTIIPVLNIINKYDAFTDGHHYNFQEYYEKYPNSLFILNTRPIKKWLISRYKHHNNKYEKSWCWPVYKERTNLWITARENHFKNILSFFKDKPSQLMIVNIEKIGWENKVLNYIKINNIWYSCHENKRNDNLIDKNIMNLIQNNVIECLQENDYVGDELLPKDINILQYKYKMYL
jgi:hypothetical protein